MYVSEFVLFREQYNAISQRIFVDKNDKVIIDLDLVVPGYTYQNQVRVSNTLYKTVANVPR